MYDLYPTDPKIIRERIRRYERIFQRGQRRGAIDDGYGKRFLLGPLYMLLGDVQGRLRHLTGTNERSRMMAASPTSTWSGHWRFGVATKSC